MSTTHSEKNALTFKVTSRDAESHARTGIVSTTHGSFETPVFMPVGTQGTVKGIFPRDLKEVEAEIILSNTLYLYMRPGLEILREMGGLHKFMGWNKPILTDSGGYQVFSLSRLNKISEEGVVFNSHFDGSKVFLSPEIVMDIQAAIGSDIAMIFDECPPPTKDRNRIKESMELTLRWSKRAKEYHSMDTQALFGIAQGGVFMDLRKESLERTVEIGFDGYALGGLSVGEEKEDMYRVFNEITPLMPENRPRYLMGIGTPLDFLEAVASGADMFDCVNPTRYGRNGSAFTDKGFVVTRNAKYKRDSSPIDENCSCYTCQNFSKAYLCHLFNVKEMLGPQLVSLHNVHFFVHFLREIRQSIKESRFTAFRKKIIEKFDPNCR